MKLKRKNMAPPPWLLLPPKFQLGRIISLGVLSTKTGLLQKGPLQLHSFPYPREFGNLLQQVGGRGREKLPLRPCQALLIEGVEAS